MAKTVIQQELGDITVPPTPKTGEDLKAVQQATATWTKQAQQVLVKITKILGNLDTSKIPQGSTTQVVNNVPVPTPHYVPAGGLLDQVLAKVSNSDYDLDWKTPHEVPAGGKRFEILVKNSSADFDAGWRSNLSGIRDGFAADIFDDYDAGVLTAPGGGVGWASAGRVVGGTVVTRNMSGAARTQNRLSLDASGSQYGRTWNWGSDWTDVLVSVLFRLNGSATFTGEFFLGMSAGTAAMFGDTPCTNAVGVGGLTAFSDDVTWTLSTGTLYDRFTGNRFGHGVKIGSTTTFGGTFAKQICVPKTEAHLLSLTFRVPRAIVATPATTQNINYNFYALAASELHQEVGFWMNSLLNSPLATGSNFGTFGSSSTSTISNVSENTGGFDSLNFWWKNTSSVPAELAGVAAVRLA